MCAQHAGSNLIKMRGCDSWFLAAGLRKCIRDNKPARRITSSCSGVLISNLRVLRMI
jgi:hypothetical protein